MEKLITIQKREKLNDIYAVDKKGNGGANHKYELTYSDKSAIDEENGLLLVAPSDFVATIQFQNGARKLDDSTHGIIDSDLLEIVRHRLQSFQNGEFATRENEIALTHIEEALMWMNRRVEDRIERNVLGTNNK